MRPPQAVAFAGSSPIGDGGSAPTVRRQNRAGCSRPSSAPPTPQEVQKVISRPVVTADQPGGHCRDTRPAGPPTAAAEERAREDVRARLLHRFPHVASEALETAAAEAFAFFADARVRHYVPVLALKRASQRLSARFGTRSEQGGEP
ncbi:three-helix bundle dimerization domain-containing protein [Streptomyces sediminimaris]|uniref:three-helix bundle dimerization domain-containing protein n=1 Tax=Streptomyces sediminimaris TaxID=3383721 RepID=UPI00399B00A7